MIVEIVSTTSRMILRMAIGSVVPASYPVSLARCRESTYKSQSRSFRNVVPHLLALLPHRTSPRQEMADTTTKRHREKYSKLICLGCRARRIRCVLPDTSIVPSVDPQPADKTCQRCQHNGLDCIVDYTTLGRPAQKRNRGVVANPDQQDDSSSNKPREDFEETITQDVDDFLLSRPEVDESGATTVVSMQRKRPSKKEVSEAMTSAFHLLAALLAKDKHFASSIGSQPLVHQSILELVNDENAALLDNQ